MSTGTEAGRRRVRLTPAPSIPVEFAGERAGEGPLTLGQLDVYTWLSLTPGHPHGVLRVSCRCRRWRRSGTWPGRWRR